MFQFLIFLYVTLPFLSALWMKERISALWRLVYAIPVSLVSLALLGQFTRVVSQGMFITGLVLLWFIRPLVGKFVFGQVHLSHFVVHGLISLLLVLGLFFF
ncbi:hypothetical protein [Streptococcus himalayensis]|uniref:Uncharacterized protein n=1 Tax=Streptococcus himalayensis TaxID=1888195 RepID=A0A917A3A9_9STRE|nr:hypothetical protein [Streptococcus himalayensis]GGE24282.1 hypothetical protein GCM10011510_01730 [Streptococcus himalayensis]